MANMSKAEQKIVNMAIEAYISVMCAQKWRSLSAEEQHDVIMAMVKVSLKTFEKMPHTVLVKPIN